MEGLTDKQRRFCEEYVIDWNATQAAIRAGYSDKTAAAIGHENLTKPDIQEYIDKCRTNCAELAGASRLKNARILNSIAEDESNPTNYRINAVRVLNRMFGWNEPERIDHTTDGQQLHAPLRLVFVGDDSPLPQSEDDIVEPV